MATLGKYIFDNFSKYGYPVTPVPDTIAPPVYTVDYSRTKDELKIEFGSLEQGMIDMVNSLIKLGYVEDKTK